MEHNALASTDEIFEQEFRKKVIREANRLIEEGPCGHQFQTPCAEIVIEKELDRAGCLALFYSVSDRLRIC